MDTRCSLAIDLISDLLEQRTGLLFHGERRTRLEDHVETVCREQDVLGAEQLFSLLRDRSERGRALFAQLVSEATINHTAFFREMGGYAHLDTIVPQLAHEPEVRVWSAASASGEELYTLVMLLAERVGFSDLRARWRFLGTDINPAVVAVAERGVYSADRALGVPDELRSRYFDHSGRDGVRVADSVRSLCTFRQLNLMHAPYPFKRSFHLVFCRNVLYYFGPDSQQSVLKSIHDVTDTNGWLVTGVSETIDALSTPWQRKTMCLYSRTKHSGGA